MVYNLKLKGVVPIYNVIGPFVNFDVIVFDSCSSTIITPISILDYTYDLGSGLKAISFLDFVDSVGCGSFSYSLSMMTISNFL